jgi:glc operon protein GlcG
VAKTQLVIELADVQKASEAMLAEASKDARPLAFCIVNQAGELLFYTHMDNCPLLSQGVARQKAYTSARVRMPSGAFGDYVRSVNWSLSDFGQPQFIGVAGGLPIKDKEGNVIGAVGVSGRQATEDQEIAQIGVDTIVALLP